ncbi:MAG: hypothetical protein ABSE96_12375 [Terracidiphilus sp.]
MARVANRVYISARPVPQTPERTRPPEFEYTGATALTVVSPLTGRKYRFERPGARMSVDPMDRSWIAFVPHLKRCI